MAQTRRRFRSTGSLAGGAVFGLLTLSTAWAQDGLRGAGLYLQLPDGMAACVSCHGPDPAANRNNLLRAAGQPIVLLKALNAIGVMGYLKRSLSDADIADLSAYLDTVARAASDASRSVWPRTVEFGLLETGSVSPEHTVWLRNQSALSLSGVAPRVAAGRFALRHDCPAALAPGAACSASVRALAPAAGEQTADALVWGDAPDATRAVVGLSARGSAGPVARLVVDPETLDMGSAVVGSLVSRPLRLLNAGTADLTLGVNTLTGPTAGAFSTTGGCVAGTALTPGSSCALDVHWRAAAPVAYEAALQWRGDGTHPAPVRLRAVGSPASAAAVPPAAPPAEPPADSPVAESGAGGCTGSDSDVRADTGTTLWMSFAAAALALRRRRSNR